MRSKLILLIAMTVLLGACGPNVLKARGTVMHPLIKDSHEMAFIRVVTIVRKEPRIRNQHTIVGDYRKPYALGRLHEPAEIPKQVTNGDGLLFTVEIYSPYKDELVKPGSYTFWLELPDGRKVPGKLHRVWGLVDLTEKVTGGHMQTHLVVKDKAAGKAKAYQHWEEVENEYQLFWRKFRVVFVADDLITMDTKYVVFVVSGHQRERRYHFDFSRDPGDFLKESDIIILQK